MKLLASIFIFFHFFISTFKWLLILTILSTESCSLFYLSILLGAYKLVAYKKCKALIITIIPILALYNINLLTELNWEWRQIRHATVKNHCVIIYGIRTFPPGQLPLGQLIPMKFLQGNWTPDFSPGKLPLDISPWTSTPWTTSPCNILPKKITLRTFASG